MKNEYFIESDVKREKISLEWILEVVGNLKFIL